jgi:membrane-associated protease RseP (regulator of RpoE activity)
VNLKVYSPWVLAGCLSVLGAATAAEERGYLGVFLAPLSDALSSHIGEKKGALVENVQPGSPAEKGGLRRYDVIVAFNGEKVKGPDDVRKKIQASKPGDALKLGLKRGSDSLDIELTLGSVPTLIETPKQAEAEPALNENEAPKEGFLGVGYSEVPPILGGHLGLGEGSGVVVADVWKDSPAAKAGIEANDVLTAVNGNEVKGGADFRRILSEKKPGDQVKIDLIHKGTKKSAAVTLSERPSELLSQGAQAPDRFFEPESKDAFRNYRFFGPGSRKGRIILQGPGGMEHVIPLPDVTWKLDDLTKKLEAELQKLHALTEPGALGDHIKNLAKELDQKLHEEGVFDGNSVSETTHSAVVRVVEGDCDITLRDQNGSRTVTVKQGDKVIADKLPYDRINTLPEDVRERVEKAAESLKEVRPAELPKEGKIKA